MGYKTIFREVMRTYEADRDRAASVLEARRLAIYEKWPRVLDIDTRLKAIGVALAKEALAGSEEAVGQLREESLALQAERSALFVAGGIPKDFFTPPYQCVHCADTGYIETAHGLPERCRCLKQRLIEKYYDLSNLKGILADENFDTFDLRYYSNEIVPDEGLSPNANMQAIYQTAMQFVLKFGEDFENLLLYGEPGLGKTFLCNCIAKDLLDQGRTVLYVTAPRLFKVIEDYRFNREEMTEPNEMLEAVSTVDLLILDDLGTEFSTVVTSSALFDIINQRLLAKKPLLISTNLSPSGMESQYSERIVSRFVGYFKMMKFFGEDIRVKKKYA